jgi:hypothetical protein
MFCFAKNCNFRVVSYKGFKVLNDFKDLNDFKYKEVVETATNFENEQ